jgi:hypothetical protein
VHTRTRIVTLAVGLAGGLAVALVATKTVQPAAPSHPAGNLAAHPAAASSSPEEDQTFRQPVSRAATNRPDRPSPSPSSLSNAQASTKVARPTATPQPRPTATPSSPSYYVIKNKAHGLCLNAMSTANTAQVDVATCNGSKYQDWRGLEDGSAQEVINQESGRCLNAKSVAKGADVDITTCQGDHNQLWLAKGTTLYLEAASSGLCLDAAPATNTSPANAQACASTLDQEWTWPS